MTVHPAITAHAGGCVKRVYASRAHALLAMDVIRRSTARGRESAKPGKVTRKVRRIAKAHPAMVCRAYVCPHCGAWHLTSQADQ